MALSAGIGVLIGLGIGSGVTALLMKRTIRRQDNALQQSLSRLNRIQEEHAQELNAALAKMEADYEQQLAAKIELYQDTHQEHLSELQAEYEARIAVLTNVPLQEMEDAAPLPLPTDNLAAETDGATGSTDIAGDGAADDAADGATGRVIGNADQPIAENTFMPIPDPWGDGSTSDAPAPQASAVTEASIPNPSAAPRPVLVQPDSAQTATELGKAAAINRKAAIRAVPQLGKLLKDDSADVRLAAVTALRDTGSIKAIPFLRQALRDSDSRIVAAASAALDRFKGVKKPAPKAKTPKKQRRR